MIEGSAQGTPSTRRIRVRPITWAGVSLQVTLIGLTLLTIYAFTTFDSRDINLLDATGDMLANFRLLFLEPRLDNVSFLGMLQALLVTIGLGVLTTVFGAVIAFFVGLLAAQNLVPKPVTFLVKSVTAFVRAVPTVLWVLFFAVSAGLGSVAAVVGMTFHSAAYLIKAYSESFEEIEPGVLEALRASGANWWQMVFQAVVPASASALLSWTFVRFEINFSVAIAMGATAGAGGIGFDMFMASVFYLDLRELGALSYAILAFAVILEIVATRLKSNLGPQRA